MTPRNYYPDLNRFCLAGPPAWWLKKLWEFDPSLVVLPSRQGFLYRLAQRRKLQLPEKVIHDVLKEQADTRMLASYSLVPVTSIIATARWDNPLMWVDLEERAPHRQGGAQKYIERVETRERDEEKAVQQATSERLDFLVRDAWKLYQQRQGLRTNAFDAKPRAAPQVQPDMNHARTVVSPSVFSRYDNPRRKTQQIVTASR